MGNSTLAILITQYNETEEIIKPMLDSILLQQNVPWDRLKVIIGNDGSNIKLNKSFLDSYNFDIDYQQFEHSYLPGTRKNLFHYDNSDYVMFCDADDMFSSNIALMTIFGLIDKGYDAIICTILAEIRENDKPDYILKSKDSIYVHGKIYKRAYLEKNEIEWHPELLCHEDSCFNVLAISLTKNIHYYPLPLYIWKWRPKTICRGDDYYLPKTWLEMIHSYELVIKDFSDRGYGTQAQFYSIYCLYHSYYTMNSNSWKNLNDIEKYNSVIYKRLKEFYNSHKLLIKNIDSELQNKAIEMTKQLFESKSQLENIEIPFEKWLDSILTLY